MNNMYITNRDVFQILKKNKKLNELLKYHRKSITKYKLDFEGSFNHTYIMNIIFDLYYNKDNEYDRLWNLNQELYFITQIDNKRIEKHKIESEIDFWKQEYNEFLRGIKENGNQ